MSLFSRFKAGLGKTRLNLFGGLRNAFRGEADASTWEAIEELLIAADVGINTSQDLVKHLRQKALENGWKEFTPIHQELEAMLMVRLSDLAPAAEFGSVKPRVWMIVGVNGVGKTTSIGKLSHYLRGCQRSVLIAAADTFRAAASEQLQIWAERTGAQFIQSQAGSDPASVAYNAYEASKARKIDDLIIDTAGRLHSKQHLMEEIKKIKRVLQKHAPDLPHEMLMVLDATTGQNGLKQAATFHQALGLTGIILTKLDGTAKGGIAVAIHQELKLPVRYVGLGEQLDDWEAFNVEAYVKGLLSGE